MSRIFIPFCLAILAFVLHQCRSAKVETGPVHFEPANVPYPKLSDYAFFSGTMNRLQANDRVIPYDLNTSLFSDYAFKARFVWMPDSVQATVNEDGMVEFPDNTVLIKNFYYPDDFRKPDAEREIIESRLLVQRSGKWEAFAYIWNEEQTEAELSRIGDFRNVSWIDKHGQKQAIQYMIPNKNQCKSCHKRHNQIEPIGPKVSNLNRMTDSGNNQLITWQEAGILQAYTDTLPTLADADDPQSGSLEDRALAYLDVNCGHCHHPAGPAHTSGLYLTVEYRDQRGKLGFCKTPVAAGKGSGGRHYSIVPGQPDSSILVYRMESDDPGIMMPELGRVIRHEEGIRLIRDWIADLEESCK